MTEGFGDAEKRLSGILFAISTKLGNVRELHEQLSGLDAGEKYVPRTLVVVNEPVEEARERLGDMVEQLSFLRGEAEHISLHAGNDMGCGPLLKTVAALEKQFSRDAASRHPKTADVKGVSVKHAAPEKGRELRQK